MRRHTTSQNIDWIQPVNWDHPLNRGLVAWYLAIQNQPGWKSGQWLDLTDPVHGNHGTLTNMDPATDWVSSSRPGGFGALEFNGAKHVDCGTDMSLQPSGVLLTIEAWFKTSSATNQTIAGNYSASSAGGYMLQVDSPGNVRFSLDTSSGFTNLIVATGSNDGEWHHAAGTYDGAAMRVFVDGLQSGSTSKTGTIDYNGANPNFNVGRNVNGANTFVGLINTVRVSSDVIDVPAIYQQSLRGYRGLLNRTSRFYSLPSGGVTPWYYMRQPSRIIGSGIGA